jgi:hypothetical protein
MRLETCGGGLVFIAAGASDGEETADEGEEPTQVPQQCAASYGQQ